MQQHLRSLSRADRERLDERGLVKLEGLVPRPDCEAMAERLWRTLAARDGVRRDDPATWQAARFGGFQSLRTSGAFSPMASAAVRSVIDDLMGPGAWLEPRAWGQPLVTFPTPGPWRLPAKVWHLDLPGGPDAFRTRTGRVFLLLAPIEARGGGTLVATGSHRLVTAMRDAPGHRQSSVEARRRLAQSHAWFADLLAGDPREMGRIDRFMATETNVDGVPCRVEEMTGETGDVYLMHPASLHTPAPNVRERPRMVLTETIVPRTP